MKVAGEGVAAQEVGVEEVGEVVEGGEDCEQAGEEDEGEHWCGGV